MKKNGIVYLVGAGPGDDKLITLRAVELLEKADVVIYDNLINERIISRYCGENCERIFVGKSGSDHTMEQEEINSLIVQKAGERDVVVRLKGGDPFIFGRGGEEALCLAQFGIEFEVVCGISSAYAVPSYAGIPVTHRGLSSSVAFITGHEDPRKMQSDINWDKLATGVQTLVFLMGVKNMPFIAERLIACGRDKNTPAAIIQNGSYATQRTVTGTLDTISSLAEQESIKPPSVIIVGEVVTLRNQINWFEKKPLFGKSIIVTRSRNQASDLVLKLEELGANVLELPTIKILPVNIADEIMRSIDNLESYDWIIFTSANGVNQFFHHFKSRGHDSRKLFRNRICAIGPATAASLSAYGVSADHMPKRFISSEIAMELHEINEIKNKSFLLPRADIAPESLRNDLLEKGAARADDVTVYKTVPEVITNPEVVSEMLQRGIDLITFTSSSTADNFAEMIRRTGMTFQYDIPCAAIGPVTAESARKSGFNVVSVAAEHTIGGLIGAILDYFNKESN